MTTGNQTVDAAIQIATGDLQQACNAAGCEPSYVYSCGRDVFQGGDERQIKRQPRPRYRQRNRRVGKSRPERLARSNDHDFDDDPATAGRAEQRRAHVCVDVARGRRGPCRATKARMDELVGQITAIYAATSEHDAAAAKAAEVAAAQEAVTARERDVASREDALIKAQTQLNVASGALASRDEALKSREAAHAQREADLAKRVDELDRRVESYRAALA